MERRLIREEQAMEAKKSGMVEEARSRLLNGTAGQLNSFATQLRRNSRDALETIFDSHLEHLKKCVQEQFAEQIRAEEERRVETIAAIEKGESEISRRLGELKEALDRLGDVESRTMAILNEGE